LGFFKFLHWTFSSPFTGQASLIQFSAAFVLTGHEAVDILVGSFAIGVGILHLGREQVLHALVSVHGVAFHLAALEDAQFLQRFQIAAVDVAGVQVGGHGVDGDSGAQLAGILDSVAGADEIQAGPAEEFVEGIRIGDVDGPASRVALIGWHVAAFGLRVGLGICTVTSIFTIWYFHSFLFGIFLFNFWLGLLLNLFHRFDEVVEPAI
jgi:hypothetical protein